MSLVRILLFTHIVLISSWAVSASDSLVGPLPKLSQQSLKGFRNCNFPENSSVLKDIQEKQNKLVALGQNKEDISKSMEIMRQIQETDAKLKCSIIK